MLPDDAKEIPGFPNYYATPGGNIWSGPKKSYRGYRKLKSCFSRHGHANVRLFKNGSKTWKQVHRLILETFVGPCPKGMECCHYNDVPSDNRLENLRWDTRSNNLRDSFRNGGSCQKGEHNATAKLNNWQVRIIKQLLKYPKEFTQKEIAKIFNISCVTITHINRKTTWTHV